MGLVPVKVMVIVVVIVLVNCHHCYGHDHDVPANLASQFIHSYMGTGHHGFNRSVFSWVTVVVIFMFMIIVIISAISTIIEDIL